MSYDLTNELLDKGAPCHWTPSVSLTYVILASRYHEANQRSYPGLEGFMRVTNLKTSAQLKNISQLKKEGWIIQVKRGQTGQRAEYKVLFIESDLHRCQCATPCGKEGSISVSERLESATQQYPGESTTVTTVLHPKRRTNLTIKTNSKIDIDRFDFVVSKIPIHVRAQITSGSNYETLIDELIDKRVPLSQIKDFLGNQNWNTSTTPGGLLLSLLRKYLFEMSKQKSQAEIPKSAPSNLSTREQLKNALADISRGMQLPN